MSVGVVVSCYLSSAHSLQRCALELVLCFCLHNTADVNCCCSLHYYSLGYILLCMILLMAGTALYRGKSSSHFRAFFLVHYLYNLWPVFIFLHVPDLWPYFLAITGAIVLERAYDFLHMTIFSTLASSRACSNGVTFLSVTRRRETYPGSYYRIKVPAISSTEWHPFSLASGVSSHHLTFFVASAGDWTKELYRIVSDETLRRETRVMVQGPFYAPAKTATKFRSKNVTLLVASGIGITPFFSVMATKVGISYLLRSALAVFPCILSNANCCTDRWRTSSITRATRTSTRSCSRRTWSTAGAASGRY